MNQLAEKYILSGNQLYQLKKYSEALEAYNKAIQLNPMKDEAWYNKGVLLDDLGRYQEALEAYNQAIQLNPMKDEAWNNKGILLKNLGRYQEALEAYNKAIKVNPNKDEAWNNKGVLQHDQGRYQEALEAYNQAIQLNPNNKKAWYNKGNALNNLGRYQEALEAYQNAVKIDPTNQFAQDKILSVKKVSKSSAIEKKMLSTHIYDRSITFAQQQSEKESEKIWKQFIAKLCKDYALFWVRTLSEIYNTQPLTMSQYFKHIINYLLISEQALKIKIINSNVSGGSAGKIHYGLFFYFINKQIGTYNKEEVAIKEQTTEQNPPTQKIIALFQEMAIMSFCNHPNIIKLKGVYFNPKKLSSQMIVPKYFMDLDSALSEFKDYLKSKKKQICCQILEALDYLHKCGFVHLDLKPSNIMFKNSDFAEIVLLDFGISNFYKDNQDAKIFGMTIAYCPPEIKFWDEFQISPKADIFSFGMFFLVFKQLHNSVLYELVSENQAFIRFKFKSSNEIYNHIRSKNFEFFNENKRTGKKEIDALIASCTHRQPTQRPEIKEVLKLIQMINIE